MIDLESWICNATVKVIVGSRQGTGFFIPPDGYILTAYHCIDHIPGNSPKNIIIKHLFYGDFMGQLNEGKSLRAYDIAVIKVDWQSEYRLPLGNLPEKLNGESKKICSAGYPAMEQANDPSFFDGQITNLNHKEEYFFVTGAIAGEGHSGGPIFHYESKRVVGVAAKIVNPGLRGSDKAIKIDPLLKHWNGLKEINSNYAAKCWINNQMDTTNIPASTTDSPNLTGKGKVTSSIIPFFSEKITSQKLYDYGILAELGKIFSDRESAKTFLKEKMNYPGGRIPNSEPDETFWKNICREIERGVIPGGLLRLLNQVAETYPDNHVFRQWHGTL